tara:strand:- start:16097 stop:17146 length:1050 start_codon:yes stop_codon:yes gene_type:complete
MQDQEKLNKYLKSFLNLSLLGIGIGVLIGSLLQITYSESTKNTKLIRTKNNHLIQRSNPLKFNFSDNPKEIIELSTKLKDIASKYEDLDSSAFLLLLDKNQFAEFYSKKILPAASTIKIPILLIALEMIDNGELLLNEEIKLEKELIGGGAGWMAYEPIGNKFPVYELANEMIRISDNTATNLLIKRLGGINKINTRFKEIGLESTQIKNLLPDLEGTNTTSTKDLAYSINLVETNQFLSTKTRDLFREILSSSKSNNMLPKAILTSLGEDDGDIDYKLSIKGYRVYNKTGDIGITYADAGLIQLPDNTRVVASFIVKGPFNDRRSPELIREMATAMVKVIKPLSEENP